MQNWFNHHRSTLDKALDACKKRYAWTAFTESPSSKIHGKEKPAAGKAHFERLLGTYYELDQPGQIGRTGSEVSPYTREPLAITYPKVSVNVLYEAVDQAMPAWASANLATGNPVVLKPHPNAILPVALIVTVCRQVCIMTDVFIGGTGMTALGKQVERSAKELSREAVEAALLIENLQLCAMEEGKRVEAAVCLSVANTLSEHDLKEQLKSLLGSVKTLKKIHFLTALPRNPVGKVVKNDVIQCINDSKKVASK